MQEEIFDNPAVLAGDGAETLWDRRRCPVRFSDDALGHIARDMWLGSDNHHLSMETVPVSGAPGVLEIRVGVPRWDGAPERSMWLRPHVWYLEGKPEHGRPKTFPLRMTAGDADLLAGLSVELVRSYVEDFFVYSNPRLEFTDHLGRRFRMPDRDRGSGVAAE